MHRQFKVVSVMTAFPYSVDWEDELVKAVDLMQAHDIRHLPVMRDGRIHGIVSDADLRMAMSLRPEGGADLRVGLVCTRHPYVVELDTPLDEVAMELADRQVGSAIVRRGSKLAGIVTTTDICRLLATWIRAGGIEPPDDAA